MKLTNKCIIRAAVVALFGVTAAESRADWFFENTGRSVITNTAGWRFAVTANTTAKTLSIAANACTASPDTATVLDFTGGVEDHLGDTYHIVSIGSSGNSILGASNSAHVPKASGLILPDTLTNIGANAFNACTNLTGDLIIPHSVTSIGNSAFHGVFSAPHFGGSLVIGDGVATIGSYAFRYAAFTNATFGASYENFANAAFGNVTFNVRTLIIPDTAKNIGDAFYASGNRATFANTSLVIGNGVTNIVTDAFIGCVGLTGTLTLGDSLRTIGNNAFQNCKFTGDLTIPHSVTSIGSSVFYANAFNGSLAIGDGMTSIGNNAFQNCGFTGTLTLGDSLLTIGNNAFNNVPFTGDLIIPHSVTSIGNSAFQGVSSAPHFGGSLVIGDGVATIGSWAFRFATFTNATFGASYEDFANAVFGNVTFDVRTLIIPDTAKNIGDAFYASGNRATFANTSLVIGNGVTNIVTDAFIGCVGLTGTLTLGDSLRTIGNNAFYNCKFTGDLTIPHNVTTIGQSAFYGIPFGGSLTLGDGVTTIGQYAFQNCRFTGQPYFGASLTNIGANAFRSTTFTADPFILPDTVRNIGNNAFRSATFGGTVFIGNGVTNIGQEAFYDCSGLARISTPSTGVTFGNTVFYMWGTTLKEVYFRGDYPVSVGTTLFNTSVASTSYVARAHVEAWTNAVPLLESNTANWQSRPIRVGDLDIVPGIVYFDKKGGYGGDDYAHVQSGKPLPSGLAAPMRDGMTFEGYWDITGATRYLDPSMTPDPAPWVLPAGTKLYARWHDPNPGTQWIHISALEVLPDGDVQLYWDSQRVKYEYDQLPYTVTIFATDDLAIPFGSWAEFNEGHDFHVAPAPHRHHKTRLTPLAPNRGFFRVKAELEVEEE